MTRRGRKYEQAPSFHSRLYAECLEMQSYVFLFFDSNRVYLHLSSNANKMLLFYAVNVFRCLYLVHFHSSQSSYLETVTIKQDFRAL